MEDQVIETLKIANENIIIGLHYSPDGEYFSVCRESDSIYSKQYGCGKNKVWYGDTLLDALQEMQPEIKQMRKR